MQPKKPQINSIKAQAQGQTNSAAFFKPLPDITPGELAVISVSLRLLMKKGRPNDYFNKAMLLAVEADDFLREFRPQPINPAGMALSRNAPNGVIQLMESSSNPSVRKLAASNLSFENLLAPTSEPVAPADITSAKKRKKSDTWFGAITTPKGLRKLIQDSERKNVLTISETEKILSDQKMDGYQYLKLREFQTQKYQARGRLATASREAKKDS